MDADAPPCLPALVAVASLGLGRWLRAEELAREEDDQAACLLTDDFQEGFDAFRNKRSADFIARPGLRK